MEKRPNNYFDDIPIHRNQMVILAILVLAYFFDQTDNMVVGYVAPSVMKTFGITMKEFAPAQSLYFIGKMFGDPKYRWRTIILFLITAGQNIPSFVFHGWNTALLQANGVEQAAALTISTIGAVGIPLGIIASGYVGAFGGRKISIGVQILLVGGLLAAYMTVPYNFYVLAILYFCFQFISMCCAMCLNLYMAESFPTQIRNTGFGVINASGRCAVAAAQWLVPYLYAAAGSTGVGAFIAGICLMGGLVTLILGWRTGSASLEEVC